ncbi:Zn(II)2Cys6 transcription factor domain-containing protein [Aspergillus lucknowensis]|uniref:Zn(2)-C6 fungal-type domain-containing protein n=1 Tax=Aspergillus lucknowensis TaxID=176173 RepID=A0ABR4LN69_9EURO
MAVASPGAYQTTFQVALRGGPIGPPFHSRRAHKKSRNGCIVCKQRRVKCDEQRPSCRRCENYGASCKYPPSPTSSATTSSSESCDSMAVQPSRTLSSLSVVQMVTKVREGMSAELAFAPRVIGDYDAVLNLAVNSFQWFLRSSTDTVSTPQIRQVMRREMIHVAFENPYLMYTILGCGVLHMNRVHPGNESRELAEAYFWQQAITLYSRALRNNIDEKSISGLVSASMLMGITSLAPLRFRIEDSWVFTGRPSDLNWFAIQGGLRCILVHAGQYIPGSIWETAFEISSKWECEVFKDEITQGREGLHPELADLCEIDDTTTAETSVYWHPLKFLSAYMGLEVNAMNASHCATWIGRVAPEFVTVCRHRDPRALVLLAHWMGLMCSLSQWQPWVEGRIRKECTAICIYLESMGDPAILPFLEYPASGCGYILQSKL